MDLRVLTGPPGSGKSLRMLDQMIVEPGCYLLCAPRTQLIDEQAVYLDDRARDQGADVPVVTIHSGQRGQRGVVARRVQDKLRRTAEGTSVSHAIVGITHETLMGLDPADIAGWYVRIDEVPDNSFTSGSISIRASWPSLTRHYDLVPIEGSPWARLTAREGVAPLKRAQIAGDAATPLAALHKAAQCPNRITVINLRDWADAAHATRPIRWWSFWSFATLSECTSVTMTGASFTGSIAYHAMMRFDGEAINLTENMVGSEIIRANPQISIHYYATHAGSTEWWETDEGAYASLKFLATLSGSDSTVFGLQTIRLKTIFVIDYPDKILSQDLPGRTCCVVTKHVRLSIRTKPNQQMNLQSKFLV